MTGRALPGAVTGRLAALAVTLGQGPRAHVPNTAELGLEVIASEQENFGGGYGIRPQTSYLSVYAAVRIENSSSPTNDPATSSRGCRAPGTAATIDNRRSHTPDVPRKEA